MLVYLRYSYIFVFSVHKHVARGHSAARGPCVTTHYLFFHISMSRACYLTRVDDPMRKPSIFTLYAMVVVFSNTCYPS